MNKIDLTGQRFGKLLVVDEAEPSAKGAIRWNCQCDCGNNTTSPTTRTLRNGTCRSCGCLQIESRHECKKIAMIGRRFGMLTVIEQGITQGKEILWVCKCDCGKIVSINGNSLRNGKTVSCNCKRKKQLITHNLSKTRLNTTWRGMKQRCSNPNKQHYNRYGGRGITVCPEWRDDFKCFYDWAMANGYQDNLTIDRIDNDGNYEPGNCQWITMKENQQKKKTS